MVALVPRVEQKCDQLTQPNFADDERVIKVAELVLMSSRESVTSRASCTTSTTWASWATTRVLHLRESSSPQSRARFAGAQRCPCGLTRRIKAWPLPGF